MAHILDGQSVAVAGVIGWITPDFTLKALAERFDESATPRNLTFYFPCGTGDSIGIGGMDRVATPGLMKRIVSGSYINPLNPTTGQRPRLMRLIRENLVEAYSWPIGASMHWLREVARRSPGYLTKIGLGTYADPRQQGGKFTTTAQEDLVRVVEFEKQEYLFYPTWPLDVAILRASTADEAGNLSFEDEPIHSSNLALALAAKASGGRVIAQVRRIVARSSRKAGDVRIPGVLVDHVVVDADQMMTTDVPFDAAYLGGGRYAPSPGLSPTPASVDKVIARRAAAAVRPGVTTIFGFGASSDVPMVMSEDGKFDEGRILDYNFTTEHGSFGGLVMSGWQFSANLWPEALLDGATQFDFIDGGNCPFAALAFAQFDAAGNVNVSRFGAANPGAGGFIDIAHNAKELLFTGSFTTAGLQAEISNGGLRIAREGKLQKLVKSVDQITYCASRGVAERGQKATLITERAVFSIVADGLVLTEIAKGVDVKRDVLDQMEFAPKHIADPLPLMDSGLFA